MEQTILISIIAACLTGVVIILSRLIVKIGRQLKFAQVATLQVACAGSPVPDTPCSVKVPNFYARTFPDRTGTPIDPDKFDKFWVKGTSMLLCGIKNNDILFTRQVGSSEKTSFSQPHVLVLKRDRKALREAVSKNDLAQFKVRRTWKNVRIGQDNLEETLLRIMESSGFKELKNKHKEAFLSNEEMLEDFKKERITTYMRLYPDCEKESDSNHTAIISTTLRASKGCKVFFSIHPARIIVGEVTHSFHMQSSSC